MMLIGCTSCVEIQSLAKERMLALIELGFDYKVAERRMSGSQSPHELEGVCTIDVRKKEERPPKSSAPSLEETANALKRRLR